MLKYSIYINLMLLIVSGCQFSKAPEATSGATFIIEEVSGTFTSEEIGSFSLPYVKKYNLAACAKDLKTKTPLSFQKFKIDGSSEILEITSDSKGCLNWVESINYNSLGESKYLQLERQIKAVGIHKGERKIHFAINPWLDAKESIVIDLSKKQAPLLIKNQKEVQNALLALDLKSQKPLQRKLWIEEGRLFVQDEQFLKNGGVKLTFDVRLNPTLLLTKMTGEKYYRPLTDGTFETKVILFSTLVISGKTHYHKLAESKAQSINQIKNGNLSIKQPLEILEIPKRGQFVLGVSVKPRIENSEDIGSQIEEFHGLYPLGEYDGLKNTAFLKLSSMVSEHQEDKKGFNLNDIASTSQKDKEDPTYQKIGFESAPLEFRYLGVIDDPGKNLKTIAYNTKICFINGLDHKPLRGAKVSINFSAPSKEQKTSTEKVTTIDINSCISFDDEMTFKPYDCPHFIDKLITIKNDEIGINNSYSFRINPWDAVSYGAIRDLRYANANDLFENKCKTDQAQFPEIQIPNYTFTVKNFNYEIDNFFNLKLIKEIHFKMDPKVGIYNHLSNGIMESQPIRNGMYLLRVGIGTEVDIEKSEYVSHLEKIVQVTDNTVNTILAFPVENLKHLGNRNTIFIQLRPVDPSKTTIIKDQIVPKNNDYSTVIDLENPLKSPLFSGVIVLNQEQMTAPLFLTEGSRNKNTISNGIINNDSNDFISLFKTKSNSLKQSVLDFNKKYSERNFFALHNNLQVVSLALPEYSKNLIQNWYKGLSLKNKFSDFMNNTTSTSEKLSEINLNSLLESGTFNESQIKGLCSVWVNSILENEIPNYTKITFKNICTQKSLKNVKDFFHVEKRFFARNVKMIEQLPSSQFVINTGTSFSLSNSFSESKSVTKSVTVGLGLPKFITEIIPINGNANINLSTSQQDSKSHSNALNIGSNVTLNVQETVFSLSISNFEKCLIIKLNPAVITDDNDFGFEKISKTWFLNSNKNASTKGLMICSGELEKNPKIIEESYFTIFQDNKSLETQDSAKNKNRMLYLNIRGKNDYERFFSKIKSQSKIPVNSTSDFEEQRELIQITDQLIRSLPTYPGQFLEK